MNKQAIEILKNLTDDNGIPCISADWIKNNIIYDDKSEQKREERRLKLERILNGKRS